jgi:hypothetical protein
MTGPAIPSAYTARDAQPVESFMQQLEARLQSVNLFGDERVAPPPPSDDDILAMRAANAIFATPDGAVLLEWFADNTVRQPFAADPGVDPAKGWAMAQRRQGQCDAFYTLLALIAAAREEPASGREGPPA